MGWAARKETAREKNMAYSLLGLFNVNMPLIYGEGPLAFQRLQEYILQRSDDHTIFAACLPTPQKSFGIFKIKSTPPRRS